MNNWNTFEYSNFVKSIDKKKIILARDHGGPWQNNIEVSRNFNLKQSMESAKVFEEDIINGFKIIHIDTSIDPIKKNNNRPIFRKIFELFEHCNVFARDKKKNFMKLEQRNNLVQQIHLMNWSTPRKNYKFCKK